MLSETVAQFGGHHRLENYLRAGELPANELQIYTWHDATLRELTDLIKSAQPAARRATARLEFALVYPDRKGRNVMRQVLNRFTRGQAWAVHNFEEWFVCDTVYLLRLA